MARKDPARAPWQLAQLTAATSVAVGFMAVNNILCFNHFGATAWPYKFDS